MNNTKPNRAFPGNRSNRGGKIVLITGLLLVALIGILACALDIGYIVMTKAQMQAATDAAALAGGTELLPGLGKYPTKTPAEIDPLARDQAVLYAAANRAGDLSSVYVDRQQDITLGIATLNEATGRWEFEPGLTPERSQYNAVRVRARRDQDDETADDAKLPLFFARIFGIHRQRLIVSSTAVILPAESFTGGPSPLLPFAVHWDLWKKFLRAEYHFNNVLGGDHTLLDTGALPDPTTYLDDGLGDIDTSEDDDPNAENFPEDSMLYFIEEQQGNELVKVQIFDDAMGVNEAGNVSEGPDGKLEFSIYPIRSTEGNFGTIDLGSTDNSTNDIRRQILTGVSEEDFEEMGGTIEATIEAPLPVEGDTGISGGLENAIEQILGECRGLAIFSNVDGPGNNAMFDLVMFEGIRLMAVELGGGDKRFVIQGCDFSATGGVPGDDDPGDDTTIFTPLILVE